MQKKINQIGFFKKLGMSRIFDTKNQAQPVTILESTPAYVLSLDKKNNRAEIAFHPRSKINQAAKKKLEKAKINDGLSKSLKCYVTEEFAFKPGDQLSISQFKPGDKVTIVSRSKGKGFSGVVKRYHFSRGPETHGSRHHRAPGSIGSMFPQRVIAGKKMPGQMGGEKITIKNLLIQDIDEQKNLLIISGSVAGPNRGEVMVFK